jgi:NADH dehydrogenase
VIVGAGFGGLAAAAGLARAGAAVTVVDRNAYSTFQPLLYQVATSGLNPSDVAYPLRGLALRHGARFRHAAMTGIDDSAQRVTLSGRGELSYDYLILATGVSAAYYGVPGADKHTLGLYTRRDAVALRDQVLGGLEQLAAAAEDGSKRDMSVTVVGGGATGVELAGTLAELRNVAIPAAFPEIDRARVHVRLVEMAPHLLAPFHPALRDYARRQLVARGVDVRLGATIREVAADRVLLADGQELGSDIAVWAAGVAAPAETAAWGLPQSRGGRIVVGSDLRVHGHDRIFAVGDIALIDGRPLPQLAQPALQMGRHAAAQVCRLTAGRPTEPFSYRDKGTMATIGRRSAVVQLPCRVRIRGTIAWVAWLALHLVTLLGYRNRLSALVNLAYRYLTWGRGGAVIMDSDPPLPALWSAGRDSERARRP